MTRIERAMAVPADHWSEAPLDWARVQRLYAFCRARAIDRIALAQQQHPESTTRERRELRVLETLYGKARQHNDIVTSCAVTYFRTQALKDAQHPDFLGEWIGRQSHLR